MVRWLALAVLLGCSTTPRTEVLIVIDSDLRVADELDQLDVTVTGPDMRVESSMALLGDGEPPLPRTLGLVYGGELGPFDVEVVGSRSSVSVVSREARFSFVRKETLVLTMHLVRACRTTDCGAGSTCTESGCQPVLRSSLPPWTGVPPRLGDVMDAGVDSGSDAGNDTGADACVAIAEICANGMDDDCDGRVDETPPEVCNGVDDDCDMMVDEDVVAEDEVCNSVDDDCDMMVDEDFDLSSDLMNCGVCGRECVFRNGEGVCTGGECVVSSCNTNFDDCDSDGINGCETDTTASNDHCGACNNRCRPPNRVCCMSTCERECP